MGRSLIVLVLLILVLALAPAAAVAAAADADVLRVTAVFVEGEPFIERVEGEAVCDSPLSYLGRVNVTIEETKETVYIAKVKGVCEPNPSGWRIAQSRVLGPLTNCSTARVTGQIRLSDGTRTRVDPITFPTFCFP